MMTRKGNCVAIWLGNFTDELDVDEYLYADFGRDFHCVPDEANVPEFAVRDSPVEISDLLKRFSQASHFAEAACKRACELGITTSSSAVIYYHTKFDPNQPCAVDAALLFLGNFEWS